jgi:hypothetical protein
MLGHTLWRKCSPRMIPDSEAALNQEIYILLRQEEWHLAKTIGRFAMGLPDPKGDYIPKLIRLNYAQSLKWSGDSSGCLAVIDIDWTASIRDLRLGVEVLKENYDNAANLMHQIGKEGELVRDFGYAKWPIFREFRKTAQFLEAYEKIRHQIRGSCCKAQKAESNRQ